MTTWKWNRWIACGLLSFAAGSLVTARVTHMRQAKADSDHVFELRIYHAVPGKLQTMESRFRDKTSKILARHNLNVVGYWTADEASNNSFIFLLAHESREAAKNNWDAMRSDPEFQEIVKSEQADNTLEKADILYMRPTDFSAMK
jgi:NIPSNAP protein